MNLHRKTVADRMLEALPEILYFTEKKETPGTIARIVWDVVEFEVDTAWFHELSCQKKQRITKKKLDFFCCVNSLKYLTLFITTLLVICYFDRIIACKAADM